MSDDGCNCLGAGINSSLNVLLSTMVSLHKDIKEIKKYSYDLNETLLYLKKIVKHYHNSHLHGITHPSDNIETPSGAISSPHISTPVDHLLREYNSHYDIDGNGMIYGVDFKLTQESAPPHLELVNKKITKPLIQLSLKEYIATIPGSEKTWQR